MIRSPASRRNKQTLRSERGDTGTLFYRAQPQASAGWGGAADRELPAL